MPLGPDVLSYQDLRLYDRSAEELRSDAVALLQTLQPDWIPRTGHQELALIEVQALMASEVIHAINRVPGVVVEGVLAAYQVARSTGAQATATATLTLGDALGHTIPAGTRMTVTVAGVDEQLVVASDVVVPVGSSTAAAPLRAALIGTATNGVPAGTRLTIVDQVPYLDAAVLATAVTGGADPESDAELATRGFARTRRLTDALVLPEHFRVAALDVAGVARAQVYPRTDPGSPGATTLGHVTVAVVGPAGALLSAEVKANLATTLAAKATAGTVVHVIDPTITTVDVALTVQALLGYSQAQVSGTTAAALAAYLTPDAWPWSGTVYRNQLIAVADGALGVDRVVSITTPSSDQALSGLAPLAKLGTVTVTVQPAS